MLFKKPFKDLITEMLTPFSQQNKRTSGLIIF